MNIQNNKYSFIFILYDILSNEDKSIIKWNDDLTITIHNKNLLETKVLPKYFNHSKFLSLNRQFNHYGFSRYIIGNKITYKNINLKNKEELLCIKRKYKKDLKKPKNTITVFGKKITPIYNCIEENMNESFIIEMNLEKFNSLNIIY